MAAGLVIVLMVLALANFIREWMRLDVFALLVIATLVATRVLTPDQAFDSFSNSAIVMIGGVMVLTGAVIHNGAARVISHWLGRFSGKSERRTASLLILATNVVSAFINNVAATAMFIPVAEGIAKRFKVDRGRYLLAIAFASMTGGMCTLIGTSTNVAVAGAMPHYGLRPLGMFELAPIGVVAALVGLVYLVFVGPVLLGRRAQEDPIEAYGLREYLFEVVVRSEAGLAGATLEAAALGRRFGANVLAIERDKSWIVPPDPREPLVAGDLLLIEGEVGTIHALSQVPGLSVKSLAAPSREGLTPGRVKMVEATVSYNSPFIGRTLKEIDFRRRFDLSILAIHRRGEAVVDKVGKVPIRAGDVLLIYGAEPMFARLDQEATNLLTVDIAMPRYDRGKAILSVGVFGLAVGSSALGLLDPPSAFLTGAALVLALGCLSVEEARSHLNFQFLVMLAGMIALGLAMEQTGAARLIATGVVDTLRPSSPLPLVAVFFLLTVLLTQPLNNAAAALLVLPIAVNAAQQAGADARAMAITVAVAASCSFITPFEPACLLVYGTGRYRFSDFIRVGGLLTAILFLVSLFVIPEVWPLAAG